MSTSQPSLTASVERVIAAPPAKIFALLADPAAHPRFDGSGTVRKATGDAGPLKVGSRFGMEMHLGVDYSMVNTVVELEPDRLIAWKTTSDAPILKHTVGGRVWRYELEPVAQGTRVRETWDMRGEKPPLKWVTFALLRGKTVKAMNATLERLDALVTG